MRKVLLVLAILLIAAGAYGALAVKDNAQSGWAHPEAMATIDDVKWAVTHPKDYIIIDASKSKPVKSVKNAIWMSFKEVRQRNSPLLKGILCYPTKPGQFDPSELQHIFRQLGVSEDKTVIVVARDPCDAGVVWFALYFLGFDNVKLLPVNYTAVGEGYLTTDFDVYSPDMPETGDFTVDENKIRWHMYATVDEILLAIEDPSIEICDVRPEAYYNGSKAKTIRGGHIYTAINIPYSLFWEDKYMKKLKSKEELEALVEEKFPREKVKKIIATCNTGHKATGPGFLIWQLGYDWALDDAAWNLHAFNGAIPASNIQILVKP